MKKKGLVIQSIVMICLTAVMLTGVSFAWLVSNITPKVESFDVSVVGVGSVNYKFWKFDELSKIYAPLGVGEKLVSNPQMIPGGEEKCCIEIKNQSEKGTITVGVNFTKVKFGLINDNSVGYGKPPTTDDMTNLADNFVIDYKTVVNSVSGIPPTPFPTYGNDAPPVGGEFVRNKFFEKLKFTTWATAPNAFEVLPKNVVSVPPKDTLYLYYRFYVNTGFTGLSSLFGIDIGGVLISF